MKYPLHGHAYHSRTGLINSIDRIRAYTRRLRNNNSTRSNNTACMQASYTYKPAIRTQTRAGMRWIRTRPS
eukprot:scaffold645158_cov20-Prasinocladus_malaysianus.AAC.1